MKPPPGKYATRAADLLSKIAISHSPVFDVSIAEPLLLSALDDTRADIVKYDATVLGVIDSADIQPALLNKATDDKTVDDLKIAVFQGLSTNARNFGKHLNDDQIGVLQKVVASAPNVDVRTAAGEVRGAMDLPADQAKQLIIDQAKTSN